MTDGRAGEVDQLRAGLVWALLRAFEPHQATDEHLHTAVWFLERHVGISVELGDFTTAVAAHQAPFSPTLADAITAACDGDAGVVRRDEWGRLQRTTRRTTFAASLPSSWWVLRPAAAMAAHHIGARSSNELGHLVSAIGALAARTPDALVNHPSHIKALAQDLLERRVSLALAGPQEAELVRRACKAGGTPRGRVGQLYSRGQNSVQIAATTGRLPTAIQGDLTALLYPLARSFHAHVTLLAMLDPILGRVRPVGSQPSVCHSRPDLVELVAAGVGDEHVATCRDCRIETEFYRVCVSSVLAPWAWPTHTTRALN